MQGELLRASQSRPLEHSLSPGRLDGLSRSGPPVLMSQRLVLRAPHAEDIDALAHLANNANIATMVAHMPHPYSAKDAAAFVARANAGVIGKCIYAVTRGENGAFMGCAALEPQGDPRTMELGFWIGEPFWNLGYATETAHALVDMVFRTMHHIDWIDARCRVTNIASRRVIQKCGFQYQGTGMIDCLAIRAMVPVEWFRLDRKTWLSLRSWGEGL